MSKRWILFFGIGGSLLLSFALVFYSILYFSSPAVAQDGMVTPEPATSDEGGTVSPAQPVYGSDEVPLDTNQAQAQLESPTIPDATTNTLVYFSPQDNDANATVVMLYNTTDVTVTVNLKSYTAGNHLGGNWNITLGPGKLVHLVSDSVVASPPPSWGATNTILTNFTDSTMYATLSIPAGVKLDGYVVFNSGTGTIDPRADQGAIPLRFSTDPLTMLLPTVIKGP